MPSIYNQDFKTRLITEFLTSDRTINAIAKDNKIANQTLKNWVVAAQKLGQKAARRRTFDTATKRALVQQWHSGQPTARLCARHRIYPSQLTQWAKELGFPARPRGRAKVYVGDDINLIRSLYTKTRSAPQIAALTGVSVPTILRITNGMTRGKPGRPLGSKNRR